MSDVPFDPPYTTTQLVKCVCVFCGTSFWSDRSTAKYCTASHKQKMYRWRVKLHSQKAKALSTIQEIRSYFTYPDSVPLATAVLHELKHAINEALLQERIVTVK